MAFLGYIQLFTEKGMVFIVEKHTLGGVKGGGHRKLCPVNTQPSIY